MTFSGMQPSPWVWHPHGIADDMKKFTPGLIAVAPFWGGTNEISFSGVTGNDFIQRTQLTLVSSNQEAMPVAGATGLGQRPLVNTSPGWGLRYNTDLLGGLGAFTAIACVEWDGGIDDQSIFGNWVSGGTRLLWRVETASTRRMRALLVTSGGTLDTGVPSASAINAAGSSTVVALRYDGANLNLFIDGVKSADDGTGSGTVTTLTPSGDNNYSWSANGASASQGEWRGIHYGGNIWNRALSDADISVFSQNFFRFWEPAEPRAPLFGDLGAAPSGPTIPIFAHHYNQMRLA
jgi:hypothetical protein